MAKATEHQMREEAKARDNQLIESLDERERHTRVVDAGGRQMR